MECFIAAWIALLATAPLVHLVHGVDNTDVYPHFNDVVIHIIYSLISLLTHSLIRPYIHTFICFLTYSLIHFFTRSSQCTYLLTNSPIIPLGYRFIQLFHVTGWYK